MSSTLKDKEFTTRLERLDVLLRQMEQASDPAVRDRVREIVQAVLDLHTAGLERLLVRLNEAGDPGRRILDACTRDEVVSGMLVLHDLHPLDTEERVRQALSEVQPYLRSHGGNVELLAIDGPVVRLRLDGSCDGCPSSAVTMQQTIEQAILGKAPEVTTIEVEGMSGSQPVVEDHEGRLALPVI